MSGITVGRTVRINDPVYKENGTLAKVIAVATFGGTEVLTVEQDFAEGSKVSFAILSEKVVLIMTEEEACELEIC